MKDVMRKVSLDWYQTNMVRELLHRYAAEYANSDDPVEQDIHKDIDEVLALFDIAEWQAKRIEHNRIAD